MPELLLQTSLTPDKVNQVLHMSISKLQAIPTPKEKEGKDLRGV